MTDENTIIAIFTVIPFIFITAYMKFTKPQHHGIWMFAIQYFITGVIFLGALLEIKTNLENQNPIGNFLSTDLPIWIYVVPTVYIGVACNLMSNFITKEKVARSP